MLKALRSLRAVDVQDNDATYCPGDDPDVCGRVLGPPGPYLVLAGRFVLKRFPSHERALAARFNRDDRPAKLAAIVKLMDLR